MLGRVAASVAHEVRNPLHAMRLIVDEQMESIPALATHPLGVEFESCLQRIDHAVDLVYRLARPESEEGEIADLLRAVRDSVTRIERSSPGACEFEWSVGPAGSAIVRGSPISLGIVIDNLLRNAVTATPRGGVVGLALASTPGHWSLRIVNPGSVDQRVSESGTGERLGLGLSISRQIAANQGARIELWSTDGLVTCELSWPTPEGEAT